MEKDMDAAIERAYTWVRSKPALMNPSADVTLTGTDISAHLDRAEFERHIYAKSLEELDLDNPKTLGYVYKCLGSAVWLLREAMRQLSLPNNEAQSPILRSTIFEKLTVDLIMQGGDADTNGSSACALLGAYLGFANLPAHWTMGLAHKEWLMDEIYRLAIASRIVEGKIMPKEDEKAEGPRGLMSNAELEDRWAKLMAQIATRQLEAKARIRGEGMKKKGIAGWFS